MSDALMTEPEAVRSFAALAHTTRMNVFRLLIGQSPNGVSAGQIAEELDVKPSTLSPHLAQLERAGLINSRRDQRQVIYSADIQGTRRVLVYLLDDCCGGQRSCAPSELVDGILEAI